MDVPDLTINEKRGLIYIHDINQELEQIEAATISQLADNSRWRSKYFTNAWKKLVPRGLVKREKDGVYTRLSTTDKGDEAVNTILRLNQVLDEAEK